jgi:hypothetical protein
MARLKGGRRGETTALAREPVRPAEIQKFSNSRIAWRSLTRPGGDNASRLRRNTDPGLKRRADCRSENPLRAGL